MQLKEKIEKKQVVVGVIGLGYVGLPLVLEFVEQGFTAIGFDIDQNKIKTIQQGKTYIKHIPQERIKKAVDQKGLTVTADFSQLKKTNCIIVAVPTPLDKHHQPDLTFIEKTSETISRYLQKDQLVVLESSTFPGTTEEIMRPILEKSGLQYGKEFLLAFSPEREDPNNPKFSTREIPKVVGCNDAYGLECTIALYDQIVVHTVPVSSSQTAEATKLLENIFRSVNIALVNEMKMILDRMGIDIHEVVEAAATKPFGYMPFYPGPGLGGHCIPIDPFYLTWKAKEYDMPTKFIELAGEINTSMPYWVVQKTVEALNDRDKSIRGAKILILGVGYKKDVDDLRESPSLKLIEILKIRGAEIAYNDPFIAKIPKVRKYDYDLTSIELTPKNLSACDAVLIATDHSSYDFDTILKHAPLIIDTRNAIRMKSEKVVKA